MKKAILIDFNGVMNIPSFRSNEESIVFQLKEEICIQRLKIVAELCVEQDAIPISVSSYNSKFVFLELFSLLQQDYKELFEQFYPLLKKGIRMTPFSSYKKDIESSLKERLSDYKVVVFEDEYKFNSFHQIWTNSHECLTYEHIQKAREYFTS